MNYAALTTDQKTLVQAFMDAFRPVMGELARNLSKQTTLIDVYASGVSALIDGLDPGEPILTTTGLAGAQGLLREDVQTFMQVLGVLTGTYDTAPTRSTYIKIAGISALMP